MMLIITDKSALLKMDRLQQTNLAVQQKKERHVKETLISSGSYKQVAYP